MTDLDIYFARLVQDCESHKYKVFSKSSIPPVPANDVFTVNYNVYEILGRQYDPQTQKTKLQLSTKCQINLKALVQKFPHTEYDSTRFAALIARVKSPKSCALIFSSGKVVLSGCHTPHAIEVAVHKYADMLRQSGHIVYSHTYKKQNSVMSTSVPYALDLQALHEHYMGMSEYDPNVFPGLIFKIEELKIAVMTFQSGKFNIVGYKHPRTGLKAYDIVMKIFPNFKLDTKNANTKGAGGRRNRKNTVSNTRPVDDSSPSLSSVVSATPQIGQNNNSNVTETTKHAKKPSVPIINERKIMSTLTSENSNFDVRKALADKSSGVGILEGLKKAIVEVAPKKSNKEGVMDVIATDEEKEEDAAAIATIKPIELLNKNKRKFGHVQSNVNNEAKQNNEREDHEEHEQQQHKKIRKKTIAEKKDDGIFQPEDNVPSWNDFQLKSTRPHKITKKTMQDLEPVLESNAHSFFNTLFSTTNPTNNTNNNNTEQVEKSTSQRSGKDVFLHYRNSMRKKQASNLVSDTNVNTGATNNRTQNTDSTSTFLSPLVQAPTASATLPKLLSSVNVISKESDPKQAHHNRKFQTTNIDLVHKNVKDERFSIDIARVDQKISKSVTSMHADPRRFASTKPKNINTAISTTTDTTTATNNSDKKNILINADAIQNYKSRQRKRK